MNVAQLFENTVVLSYNMTAWGNKRKADLGQIRTDADKSRLGLSKKLIDSKEYNAITKYQADVREWLGLRAAPSFFKNALMLVKIDMIDDLAKYLEDAVAEQQRLVTLLMDVYDDQKRAARIALGSLYREEDYPLVSELPALFTIRWNWIELNVAENLPKKIREQENEKLQNLWEESIREIINGLRTGFKELVDHAVDRLTPGPDGKPKIFKETLIPNLKEFLDTFSARNVVNDTELNTLVDQARKLLDGVSTNDLRTDTNLRDYTALKLSEMQKTIDESITTVGRKFNFSEK